MGERRLSAQKEWEQNAKKYHLTPEHDFYYVFREIFLLRRMAELHKQENITVEEGQFKPMSRENFLEYKCLLQEYLRNPGKVESDWVAGGGYDKAVQ